MVNELIVKQLTVNEFTVNIFAVNRVIVPETCFLNINDYSSHGANKFFHFAGNYIIRLICLHLYATHFLQSLEERICKPLFNAYCLKIGE